MRTTVTGLIVILAASLLSGSTVGVAAQDDAGTLRLVTEDVEPGVERIISDGVGHDLDETHPTSRYDMDGIAVAADGTIWLATTYHDSDNAAHPDAGWLIWALGRPGVYGKEQGVPENGGYLVPLRDGSLLVVGEEVVRLDGQAFVPDDAYVVRPTGLVPAMWTGFEWLSPADYGRWATDGRGTWCWGGVDGVTCEDPGGNRSAYLAGTFINQLAATSDGSVWAVGDFDGGPGGLYRITLESTE